MDPHIYFLSPLIQLNRKHPKIIYIYFICVQVSFIYLCYALILYVDGEE